LLTGDQNEGQKLRTAREKEHGISSISKPLKRWVLHQFTFLLKTALAQKDHYLTCLEGRKGQRKGISKGKASNRLPN